MRRAVALLARHFHRGGGRQGPEPATWAMAHGLAGLDRAVRGAASTSQAAAAAAAAASPPASSSATTTRRPRRPKATPFSPVDADPAEVAKFAAAAGHDWWDPAGPAAPLHAMNSTRVLFARQAICEAHGLDPATPTPLAGLRLADVGCGGGLFAEALARLGARVMGVDASPDAVAAAAAHAAADPAVARRVTYRHGTAASLADSHTAAFDAVIASEVIEHVPDPVAFLAACRALLKHGSLGPVVVSTLARTPRSWGVAILGAERLARILPAGTHDWHRFLTAEELAAAGEEAGLALDSVAGMAPDLAGGAAAAAGLAHFFSRGGGGPPPSWAAALAGGQGGGGGWKLTQDLGVNYIGALVVKKT